MSKWERKISFKDDTFTKISYVKGESMDDLKNYLAHAKTGAFYVANSVVAKVGKEARKVGAEKEASIFDFGEHEVPRKVKGSNFYKTVRTESYWDSDLGGFRTKRRKGKDGDDFRLANFSYLKVAEDKEGKVKSEAKFTSQIANLFENTSEWTKNSPYFRKAGGNWRNWSAGPKHRRGGKHYFNDYIRAALSSSSTVISEVDRDYKKYLEDYKL